MVNQMHAMTRPVTVAAALLLLLVPTAVSQAQKPPPISLSATPDQQQVTAGLPCLPAPPITLGITNPRDEAVYADTFLRHDGPLVLSRGMFSSYIPPATEVTAPVRVSAPYDTALGRYEISLESDRESLRIPIDVVAPPEKGPGDNLILGEQADPSSTYVTSSVYFSPCGGVDGDRTWSHATAWNSANSGTFPATYTVTLPEPELMNRVELYTNAAVTGLRDWDVRVMTPDDQWQTVAEVRGNTLAHVTSTFPAVEAVKVEIVGLDANRHDYVRIAEVEAYYDAPAT